MQGLTDALGLDARPVSGHATTVASFDRSARRPLTRGAFALASILWMLFISIQQARCASNGAPYIITGIVTDSIARPIAGADLTIETIHGRVVTRLTSDKRGAFRATGLSGGRFLIRVSKSGFKAASKTIDLATAAPTHVVLSMESQGALSLPVVARRLEPFRSQVSTAGATLYHFSRQAISELPQGQNSTINQVLLQAPGMLQDSNGQALPRGMDDALQYRIDGVMLPNVQLLDLGQLSPRFAESIDVLTGALPAEMGYRTGGVVDIRTRSGAALNGGGLEYYGGQRGTIEPSFELGGASGRLSWFGTGYFLHDDRGLNPPTPGPNPINDFTNQGSGLGYLTYALDADTSLTALGLSFVHDFGWPATPDQPQKFPLAGVPIYPSAAVSDSELEQTHFGMLALKGRIASRLAYQLTLFSQYSAVNFHPDVSGDLIFDGLASKVFRSSFANGSQADATWSVAGNQLGFGYYCNLENVEIDDHAMTFPGSAAGPTSDVPIAIVDNHNFVQALYGLYIQDHLQPTARLGITVGVRWDQLVGFLSGHQASPRIALSYRLGSWRTILHSGAASYFVPPPSEFVSVEDLAKFEFTTAAPTVLQNSPPKPMTDYYFDIGLSQPIAEHVDADVTTFFQLQRNVLDEGQFGSSLIFSPINYRRGRNYGVEASAQYRKPGGLSSYFNFSYLVAQVEDVASGQFNFDPAEISYLANHYAFIDQAQMFTASSGLSYRLYGFALSLTATAGSGLRSGFANTHTMPPYVELDGGVLRDFEIPGVATAHARLSVINLLDKIYQFHNGSGIGVGMVPQYMARRAVYFGVGFALPSSGTGRHP
ncbi:MAG TPA: TonB-dependent receptor [Candidatus Binataceae bacterium]|nr:TonB-dependent receptor [Candidatus Binataceae bacterium]